MIQVIRVRCKGEKEKKLPLQAKIVVLGTKKKQGCRIIISKY